MPPGKTILICDDDQGMRDTIAAILKRDYNVLTVSSGEAALGLLKHEDVDLILLDVRLPGISGFDVLRIVKENYSLVECIMISAINEVETAVQAMKHGAYHYITKDFDYDHLRSLVRNASERQDLNRQVLTLSAQVTDEAEKLVETDAGLLFLRRLLFQQLELLETGQDPIGVLRDAAQNQRIELPQEENKYGGGASFSLEYLELGHFRYSPIRDELRQLFVPLSRAAG